MRPLKSIIARAQPYLPALHLLCLMQEEVPEALCQLVHHGTDAGIGLLCHDLLPQPPGLRSPRRFCPAHSDLSPLCRAWGGLRPREYALFPAWHNARMVATSLCEWENHETDEDFDASLLKKRFAFEAFDCYIALFYLAFWEMDANLVRNTSTN